MDRLGSVEGLSALVHAEPALILNANVPLLSVENRRYTVENVVETASASFNERPGTREDIYRFLRGLHWTFYQYQDASKDELANLFPTMNLDEADSLRQMNLSNMDYFKAISETENAHNLFRNALFEQTEMESQWLMGRKTLDLPVQIFYKKKTGIFTLWSDSLVTTVCHITYDEPQQVESAVYEMLDVPKVVQEMDFDICACLSYGLGKIGEQAKAQGGTEYPFLFTGQAN